MHVAVLALVTLEMEVVHNSVHLRVGCKIVCRAFTGIGAQLVRNWHVCAVASTYG